MKWRGRPARGRWTNANVRRNEACRSGSLRIFASWLTLSSRFAPIARFAPIGDDAVIHVAKYRIWKGDIENVEPL